MRRIRRLHFSVLGMMALATAAPALADAPALMPLPRSITANQGQLIVTGPFAFRWSGCGAAPPLDRAADRLRADVVRQTGLILDESKPVDVVVTCRSSAFGTETGEAYRLIVTADRIRIEPDGPMGAFRALATLRQLVGLSPGGIAIPGMTIDDSPRFAWRGVMLDVARHFFAVSTIKRQIDAMERVKLNVLHLHLSDDQGFRVESRRYPRLTRATDGEFYTQDQIGEIVAYAAERGVRVVPEFDVPGHTQAIVAAYPELGVVGKNRVPGMPDVALNPGADSTYRFLARLFGEMAALFPDRYFHVGGDEVPNGVWDGNAAVDALKKREKLPDTVAVEGYFHRRVAAIVKRLGKTMIGWEEVAASSVPSDVVVQAWQSSNATAKATARGHAAIVSAGYYLDLLMPAEFHYRKDPLDPSAAGLSAEHAARLRKLSPLLATMVTDAQIAMPHNPLTPAQAKLVLGGEAPMWSELVTDEMVDSRLWPRAAALAERFWSPATVRDVNDMYRRLAVVGSQLTVDGLEDRNVRMRMAVRLAPGEAVPVEDLLAITGPVRNMAHDHRIKASLAGKRVVQPLNALADAAPVDSLDARRFAADAARYVGGDKRPLSDLRARLAKWRDNQAAFATIAKGRPLLEEAEPTSAQIALLSTIGLEAIEALEGGRAPDPAALARWRSQLEILRIQEDVSLRPFDPFFKAQPPADLIVKIGPGVRTLVDAAAAIRR